MAVAAQEGSRPRARDIGVAPGVFAPGPLNAITDVAGVSVGHTTLIEGDRIRTGVTVIRPHQGNVFQEKVPAAVFVGNAFGKLAGSTQVDELGTLETPIALTNTLAVGAAVEGLVQWTLAQPGNADVRSVNALVGETNDGGLNDIRALAVRPAHVLAALAAARARRRRGRQCRRRHGHPRLCLEGWHRHVVAPAGGGLRRLHGGGARAESNYGGVLSINGAPVGKLLGRYAYQPTGRGAGGGGLADDERGDGSCMIVVATDAPLDARDLKRLAARAVFGLARTGSSYSNGSGDFAIAFSTEPSLRVRFGDERPATRTLLPTDGVSPLFQAALEATEEAVYNSLLRATTVTSAIGTAEALPVDKVREILSRYRAP